MAGKPATFDDLALFASIAYTDAAYTKALNPLLTTLIVGKQVEFAPKMITRAGLTYRKGYFGTTLQIAYRRALGFPGPGIIPSDGRTGYLMVGFKI